MNRIARMSRQRRRLLGALPILPALSLLPFAAPVRAALSATGSQATPERQKLVLAGPAASVSNPLIHMVESGALADLAGQVEFVLWNNPDQLRVLAMGGDADFIAVPTNVAANMYNRGVALRLVNVSVWGALWVVSRDQTRKSLADFRGEEIAIPFRADMPDILFSFLAEQQGMDVRKDCRLRYTSTPMDAVQLLVMHQVDHALLAEPAVSMVLRKTRSFPLSLAAPALYRSVNLQDEWGRVLNRDPLIPQAGMAAVGPARLDTTLVARFEQAYAASSVWCAKHADECGEMVARHVPMLTPEAVSDSIAATPAHYATAAQARPELEYFYRLLLDRQPAVVGDKMPNADFYSSMATLG